MNTAQRLALLNKFLADRSITFDYRYITTGDTSETGENWPHHRYSVSLVREDHRPYSINTEFKSGIGNTTEPTALDVLYSFIADLVNGESFEDWCGNLGYDTDSRKAEKVYLACLKQEENIKGMFTEAEIEELQKLLQDY